MFWPENTLPTNMIQLIGINYNLIDVLHQLKWKKTDKKIIFYDNGNYFTSINII